MREATGRGDERMKSKGCVLLKLVVVAFPHAVKQNQTRERQLGKWSLPSNYDKALIHCDSFDSHGLCSSYLCHVLVQK